MDVILSAASEICGGATIPMDTVLEALRAATERRRTRALLEFVTGGTIVVGPTRGHACDLAAYLLRALPLREDVQNIVFLGNYIDGAHRSIEVLYLIALLIIHADKRIVPLSGKHELLYPLMPENFGSLRDELVLRCQHTGARLEDYEADFRQFFALLSVACVVDGKYFCVAGGPASAYRYLAQIQCARTPEDLKEFVVNEQMDEDEERLAEGSAFVSAINDDAFRFTFNAACNFVTRNNLATLIVGMEYHINRPDYDSFARANHYKESIYFPGYILGRIHPLTHLPAVVTMFSAPSFCAVNRNNASVVTLSGDRIEIHEVKADPAQPLISPGRQDHAFSWAQPMLERAVVACAREMIFGLISDEEERLDDPEYKRLEAIALSKMRRMCQLLRAHDLPLPELPNEKRDSSSGAALLPPPPPAV